MDTVDFQTKNLPRFLKSKGLDILPDMGLELPPFSTNAGKIKPITVRQALVVWGAVSPTHPKALALVLALAEETLERRADRAFGIQRTEEEYEARTNARADGMVIRLDLSTAVEDYRVRHQHELSLNSYNFMHVHVTNDLYKLLFGMATENLEKLLDADRNKSRDLLSAECLLDLASAERFLCNLIMNRDMHPRQAVQTLADLGAYKTRQPERRSDAA